MLVGIPFLRYIPNYLFSRCYSLKVNIKYVFDKGLFFKIGLEKQEKLCILYVYAVDVPSFCVLKRRDIYRKYVLC